MDFAEFLRWSETVENLAGVRTRLYFSVNGRTDDGRAIEFRCQSFAVWLIEELDFAESLAPKYLSAINGTYRDNVPVKIGREDHANAHEAVLSWARRVLLDLHMAGDPEGWSMGGQFDPSSLIGREERLREFGTFVHRPKTSAIDRAVAIIKRERQKITRDDKPRASDDSKSLPAAAWLSCPDIAKLSNVSLSTLEKQLERFRRKPENSGDWREDDVVQRTRRGARYVYRVGAVQGIIDVLKAKGSVFKDVKKVG